MTDSPTFWRGPDPTEPSEILEVLHYPMATAQAARLAAQYVQVTSVEDLKEIISNDQNHFLLSALATAIGEEASQQEDSRALEYLLYILKLDRYPMSVRHAAVDALESLYSRE